MPRLLHCDFTYVIFYSFLDFGFMTFFAIAGTLAHIANGSDLFSFNFGFMTFFAIAGTVAHIADGSDIWKPRIYTDPQSHSASLHIAGQH